MPITDAGPGGDVVIADAGSGAVASAELGPEGGSVSLPDGASVEIPPGALGSDERISVRVIDQPPSPPGGQELRGRAYAFEPHGQRFEVPVTLRLPFTGDAEDVTALRLDDDDDATWETVSGGTATSGDVLELSVSHFSIYAAASAVDAPDASVPPDAAADLDECLTDNGGCDPLVTCESHADAPPTCGACPFGYSGSGDGACVDIDECAGGVLATCGEGATDCTNLAGGYSCTCDAQHVGTDTQKCVLPTFCEPPVPLAGETCYDFTAHGVSSPSDTTKFTAPTGESISAYYFDVPWAAGTVASRIGFVADAISIVADAWLYDSGSSAAAGTVASNVTGTVLGDDATLLDHWGPGGCELTLPADVGLHLPDPGRRVMLSLHYYNATGAPQPDGSVFRVCTVAPGTRAHVAGLTLLGTENLNGVTGMPPGTSTYSSTCPNDSAAPITLIALTPQAHWYATHARAIVSLAAGGTVTVLDQPYDFDYQVHFDAGSYVMAPGDQITTSCTYDNTTSGNVPYGLSLQQEACYVLAVAYPYGALDDGVVSLLGATNTCW